LRLGCIAMLPLELWRSGGMLSPTNVVGP